MARFAVAALAVLLLGACSTSTSNTYNANDVGSVIETSEGTVLTSRVVNIEGGENSGAGAIGGGAVGATTGYAVTGGSAQGLGLVLGAVVGAAAGYFAEEAVRSREGIEYVVRMNDGRVVTLVQNREEGEEPLPDGSPVLVQYGNEYTRVIELPEDAGAAGGAGVGAGGGSGASGGGSGWTNPDEVESTGGFPGAEVPPSSSYDSNYSQ